MSRNFIMVAVSLSCASLQLLADYQEPRRLMTRREQKEWQARERALKEVEKQKMYPVDTLQRPTCINRNVFQDDANEQKMPVKWANYLAYKNCDRAPAMVALEKADKNGISWVKKHWTSRPPKYLKKSQSSYQTEVIRMQDELFRILDENRHYLSIAASECMQRSLPISRLKFACQRQNELMRSEQWVRLRDVDRGRRTKAFYKLKAATESISDTVDAAFIDILPSVQRDFDAWAVKNPESAQMFVFKHRMEAAEKTADKARKDAVNATQRAIMAEVDATRATAVAAAAESSAQESKLRAENAEVRAEYAEREAAIARQQARDAEDKHWRDQYENSSRIDELERKLDRNLW